MTTARRIFIIVWTALIFAGSLLNATAWVFTGSVGSLAVSLFAAVSGAYWLLATRVERI